MTQTSILSTVEPPTSCLAELKKRFEAPLVKVWCSEDLPFQDQPRNIGVKKGSLNITQMSF